ncbi:MAG: signal peptidase II [Candidatus Wallbacteria bacterium]|nr:signal peptidase II [Candidatus Wallbacteria bacterium]
MKRVLLYILLGLVVIIGLVSVWPFFVLRRSVRIVRRGFISYLPALLLFAGDWYTKRIATDQLCGLLPKPLLGSLLGLEYTKNFGAAFGIFQRQQWLFIAVALSAIIILFILSCDCSHKPAYLKLAYGCLLGGALGNLADRLSWGYVIDFIHLRGFPIFNLADLSIDIGLVLIFWYILREKKEVKFASDPV